MAYDDPDDAAEDHTQQHECGHVVSRLHQNPHRNDSCCKQIDHQDEVPLRSGEVDRKLHAKCEHQSDEDDGGDELPAFCHLLAKCFLHESIEILRDGAICSGDISIERGRSHGREGSDDQAAEQPAE